MKDPCPVTTSLYIETLWTTSSDDKIMLSYRSEGKNLKFHSVQKTNSEIITKVLQQYKVFSLNVSSFKSTIIFIVHISSFKSFHC